MPWLLRGDEVLASVCEARTFRSRAQGLIGRRVDGVLLIESPSIHTFGMRRPIDVAFCRPCTPRQRWRRPDGALELEVECVRSIRPYRISRFRRRGRFVLEADAGSFASWGLRIGERVVVR
ncbi:MAG: DUF192 domain-containing protein [Actinomycetota bacterium]